MKKERRKKLGKDLVFLAIAAIFAVLANLSLSQRLDWALLFIFGWSAWLAWRYSNLDN